jgi:hypothetical protein
MGEILATFLLLALTIGLAVPLVPFATRLARRSVHDWKDAVLVVAITAALMYVTFAPASLLGAAVAYVITTLIVSPILSLAGSNIGQGAIAFLFVWVGVWAVAMFCAACVATAQLNDWWNRRSG